MNNGYNKILFYNRKKYNEIIIRLIDNEEFAHEDKSTYVKIIKYPSGIFSSQTFVVVVC